MLNDRGEADWRVQDDEQWTLDGVADRNRAGDPYIGNRVTGETAKQTLLSATKPVRSLYILSDAPTTSEAIPSYVAQLPDLVSLRIPSQISATLRPELIGDNVKRLAFYGTYDPRYWNNKTVTLPAGITFPGVEALTGETLCYRVETRFRFDPAIFPNLRSLGFTFDPKRPFADTLRALPHLIATSAAAFDSIETLADMLPCDNLISLTLSWNKQIETLQGIERFPNLQYLKLGSLTQLRTLDGVDALKRLKFVGVYWSKRVEKVDALLDLPNLSAVDTIGINPAEPCWQSLEREAAERGIPVRLIG